MVKVGGIVGTFAHSTVFPSQNSDRKPSTLATNDSGSCAQVEKYPHAWQCESSMGTWTLQKRWRVAEQKRVATVLAAVAMTVTRNCELFEVLKLKL